MAARLPRLTAGNVGLLCLLLLAAPPAGEARRAAGPAFGKAEFQPLLQRFVDEQYLKSFKSLGVEDDFDHVHLLFDAAALDRPIALLYHTQELVGDPAFDPAARNWLQWVGRGTVENAQRYERRSYPHTAAWDWFQYRELGALRERHTILDKMLDPALLGAGAVESRQWVFTRADCAALPPDAEPLRISLPRGPAVCLALSQD